MKLRLLFAIAAWAAICSPIAARADVVPIVSTKSAVTSLSAGQVADIFLGKTSRFPDGSQAVPVDQPEESAARDRFYSQFTGKSPAQVKAYWSKIIFTGRGQPPRQVANAQEAKRFVLENPNAIAYIDASQLDDTVRVVSPR